MPCESAALSPSCSGTWMHVAQARRREAVVRGGAGARWGWCAVGLVRGGACGRPGRRYTPRGSWAALQGPAAQPAPKRPQLSSQAQRAAVCFLLIGVEMEAGSESALPSSRPPISRPAPTLRTCRRTGGSTISWTVTTSRTWIATRTVEGVRLEDGRMAAAWLLHGHRVSLRVRMGGGA